MLHYLWITHTVVHLQKDVDYVLSTTNSYTGIRKDSGRNHYRSDDGLRETDVICCTPKSWEN